MDWISKATDKFLEFLESLYEFSFLPDKVVEIGKIIAVVGMLIYITLALFGVSTKTWIVYLAFPFLIGFLWALFFVLLTFFSSSIAMTSEFLQGKDINVWLSRFLTILIWTGGISIFSLILLLDQ